MTELLAFVTRCMKLLQYNKKAGSREEDKLAIGMMEIGIVTVDEVSSWAEN